MPLETEYARDAAWKQFVAIHEVGSVSGEPFRMEAFSYLGDIPEEGVEILQIAVSYFGIAGTHQWLDQKIPALNGIAPRTYICTEDSVHLTHRIREYFLRFPV